MSGWEVCATSMCGLRLLPSQTSRWRTAMRGLGVTSACRGQLATAAGTFLKSAAQAEKEGFQYLGTVQHKVQSNRCS